MVNDALQQAEQIVEDYSTKMEKNGRKYETYTLLGVLGAIAGLVLIAFGMLLH